MCIYTFVQYVCLVYDMFGSPCVMELFYQNPWSVHLFVESHIYFGAHVSELLKAALLCTLYDTEALAVLWKICHIWTACGSWGESFVMFTWHELFPQRFSEVSEDRVPKRQSFLTTLCSGQWTSNSMRWSQIKYNSFCEISWRTIHLPLGTYCSCWISGSQRSKHIHLQEITALATV